MVQQKNFSTLGLAFRIWPWFYDLLIRCSFLHFSNLSLDFVKSFSKSFNNSQARLIAKCCMLKLNDSILIIFIYYICYWIFSIFPCTKNLFYLWDVTNEEHNNDDSHNAHGAIASIAMWDFPMEHDKCTNQDNPRNHHHNYSWSNQTIAMHISCICS